MASRQKCFSGVEAGQSEQPERADAGTFYRHVGFRYYVGARRRFQTSLLTVFAVIALSLALVGLYGLMSYSVGCRTREVGILMALGAKRSDVVLLMLKRAALLLALGLISGLVAC